jgi:hypothetical protein
MANEMLIASANLWTMIDIMRLMKGWISFISPKARPSKIECTLSAIMRTKGRKLNGSFSFFPSGNLDENLTFPESTKRFCYSSCA